MLVEMRFNASGFDIISIAHCSLFWFIGLPAWDVFGYGHAWTRTLGARINEDLRMHVASRPGVLLTELFALTALFVDASGLQGR